MKTLFFLSVGVLIIHGTAQAADPVLITGFGEQNGNLTATVMNDHTAEITGLLVEATVYSNGKPKFRATQYLDIYVNAFHDQPVGVRERRVFPLLAANLTQSSLPSVRIMAAVFADGLHYGSDEGIRVLLGRRESARKAIELFRVALASAKGADLWSVRRSVEGLTERQQGELKMARPKTCLFSQRNPR